MGRGPGQLERLWRFDPAASFPSATTKRPLISSAPAPRELARAEKGVPMRPHAFGLVVASCLLPGILHAAWIPPAGFTRMSETFVGDAFAVAPDGKVAI